MNPQTKENAVNVFAAIGVVATSLFAILGLGVATGKLKVSISRTKKETVEKVEQVDKSTESTMDNVEYNIHSIILLIQ